MNQITPNEKNEVIDIIWILPAFIGSTSICGAALIHLGDLPSPNVLGWPEWVYQISLVMVVLGLGFKFIGMAAKELKKIF